MSWRDRVNDLLYDGETVQETVDVGANRVYVSSHRVLAFPDATADDDAANFRHVDHPNVEGVTAGSESDRWALAKAVAWGIAGVSFVVAGVVVEVGDWFSLPESVQSGGVAGTGGIVSLFADVFGALALLDEAVALAGACFLVVATWHGVRHWRSRDRVVTVGVAGDTDVRLRVDAGEVAAAERLRTALRSVERPETTTERH
ncbi:hypothetical protein [Halorubellus salinus]|uniref:hypothetical protein n=1 Tax=Halorubellus salinus TaxID=755309 RepID=UPI001D076C26|nr:hypothetical protein [Halorubellus salinus]